MQTDPRPAHLRQLPGSRADGRYGLHDIPQRQRALQAATLAEADGYPASLIAAALPHEVEHPVHDLPTPRFGPEVTEPVRLHVAAQRFPCTTEADYVARLSLAPLLSLGGTRCSCAATMRWRR